MLIHIGQVSSNLFKGDIRSLRWRIVVNWVIAIFGLSNWQFCARKSRSALDRLLLEGWHQYRHGFGQFTPIKAILITLASLSLTVCVEDTAILCHGDFRWKQHFSFAVIQNI